MADVVVGSSSITGHVDPMLSIAAHLRGAGHIVRILTGSRFAERVAATRAEFVPPQAAADFNDTDLDAAFPGR